MYNFWAGALVGAARKRYGIPYPTLYAIAGTIRTYGPDAKPEGFTELITNEEAYKFNCIQ